jgi:nitrogen fixation protein NifU and related proteins
VTDLRELYQSVILDHNRRPRNYGALADATASAEGLNPLCGDAVTVWIQTAGARIVDIGFVGEGCAISKASASLMTTIVKGQPAPDVVALADRFQAVVTGALPLSPERPGDDALRSLAPLAGVSRFPERVKCATLAWHALRAALDRARGADAASDTATATPPTAEP